MNIPETITPEECVAFEKVFTNMEMLKLKAEVEQLRFECLKHQIKAKYQLQDNDKIDFKTGLITREVTISEMAQSV